MHVYGIAPIDFGWELLLTVAQFEEQLKKAMAESQEENSLEELHQNFERAKAIASQHGWEGDFRGQPRVLPIPSECEFKYGFAWKQDNNGTTFVVSPVRMPWLEQHVLI